jgi:hypothetical protein
MSAKAKAVHHHLRQHAKETTRSVAGTAQLTYYIFEGVLVGCIERDLIHISAWSGGGGGSTQHRTDDSANNPYMSANNPYMYALKEVDNKAKHIHIHGGPIPPGAYRIHSPDHHPKLGLSAQLQPLTPLPNNRGGFYIHGQGPHGSDGCIVPSKDDFQGFMEKLKVSKGGKLHVSQAMDGVAFA